MLIMKNVFLVMLINVAAVRLDDVDAIDAGTDDGNSGAMLVLVMVVAWYVVGDAGSFGTGGDSGGRALDLNG